MVGPLSMYPPAEDNYGTNACSVLCLSTCPPVLVIATAAGKLYHCVVLSREDNDDTKVGWGYNNNIIWYCSTLNIREPKFGKSSRLAI